MTDTTRSEPKRDADDATDNAGVKRPDQGGTTQPGQKPAAPASGGGGAEGAGGPKGFGTGT